MTRQMIEITFGNALTQASHLEECADDMMRLANEKMGSIKSNVQYAWEGDSARAYIEKMNMTASNIVVTANKLRQTAKAIRKIAYTFRQSELRAIEIAERRTY